MGSSARISRGSLDKRASDRYPVFFAARQGAWEGPLPLTQPQSCEQLFCAGTGVANPAARCAGNKTFSCAVRVPKRLNAFTELAGFECDLISERVKAKSGYSDDDFPDYFSCSASRNPSPQ